jgi:DNA-binding XRE family transcriptional regulator
MRAFKDVMKKTNTDAKLAREIEVSRNTILKTKKDPFKHLRIVMLLCRYLGSFTIKNKEFEIKFIKRSEND